VHVWHVGEPANKEVHVNRKQLIIGGVIIVFAVLLTLGVTISVVVWDRLNAPKNAMGQQTSVVPDLPYCGEDDVKPCVVSFGVDVDDNMLINLLVPESYSRFYLKIMHNGVENVYKCVRVRASLYSAYCIGEKMPPGEALHLMLIVEKDDTLLAEGDLSIIGLAFPTVEIVSPTAIISPTLAPNEPSAVPEPTEESTEIPDFVLPTSTPGKPQPSTSTPTQPSYPNPSSSTPSYP